jgi:hypothetical protein
MSARVYRDVIFERSGVTILARIRGREFNLIRQADINIISLSVYNATDNQTVPTLAQTIPLSAILDSPLDINSNPRWTQGGVYIRWNSYLRLTPERISTWYSSWIASTCSQFEILFR